MLALHTLQQDMHNTYVPLQRFYWDLEQAGSQYPLRLGRTQAAVGQLATEAKASMERDRQTTPGAIVLLEERPRITQLRSKNWTKLDGSTKSLAIKHMN